MTYAELVEAVTKLPADERLRLLETIARSLRDEGTRHTRTGAEMRGIFSMDEPPPTDDEVKEMYTAYLVEKYR